jgi:cell division protein FtsZ
MAAAVLHAEKDAVIKALAGVRTAILVTALGGGMGTGGTPVLARLLRDAGARVLVVACLPFEFEVRRRRLAEAALRDLFDSADVVLTFANERVLHLPECAADIREAFRAMNGLVARAAFGLQRLLEGHGSAPLGIEDLRRHAGRTAMENAWTGSGSASGAGRAASVVEQIM